MTSISTATHQSIVSLLSSGYSTRQIENKLGVIKSTVSNVSKIYEVDKENIKFGCPRKLSAVEQHAVLTLVRTSKAATAVAAAKHINSVLKEPVTVQTIRNVFKEDGYKSYAKKKQPFLNARQNKARLAFAQKHQNWTVEDCK